MFDVFFFEAFKEEQEALKKYLPHDVTAGFFENTVQEWEAASVPAPLVSMRTQSVIPEKWMEQISGILTRSTGYDHILRMRKKTSVDVPAGYLPLYCSRSVAEQALLLWMCLLRKLPQQVKQLSQFNRGGLTGTEVRDKTLVTVGVGNIGYEVCCIGRGLGMKVLGVDIIKKYNDIQYVTPEQGVANADIIVCAMNLTDKNRGYFTYELLRRSKPGAVFVNIARGELSPPEPLLRLVKEGHLGGAGIDVYDNESELACTLRSGWNSGSAAIKAYLDLIQQPNVICTPHNAFNTEEAVQRKTVQSVEQVVSFVQTGEFIWKVPGV